MSKRKQQENLEDEQDAYGKQRVAKKIIEKDFKQSSCDDSGHQTDNDQVDFEDKKSEIRNESVSKDDEFEKLTSSTAGEPSQANINRKNIETSLQFIKNRCVLLKKFADQSRLRLDSTTQNATPGFQGLLTLLQKYHCGLAQLLKERCYFFLMHAEDEKVFDYAQQLATLAGTLHDRDLEEEAKSILTKKFSEIKDKSTASLLHKKHKDAQTKSEEFLERVRSGSQNRRNEYAIFSMLYKTHIHLFNMQEALELNSECLKIACELNDETMLIDLKFRKTLIYQLLGKYEDSYNKLSNILALQINDTKLKCNILTSFSVVSLLLGKRIESLHLAQQSLPLAKIVGEKSWIACSYGNLGLAEESMGNFAVAIEHYQKCFELGKEAGDDRIINNSYCNLGRAYEGLGEKEMAKDNYQKAVDTPQPPKAHWCDTEDFRFSGDFLLAKMAINDQNWSEARGYLQQVLDRCESLRRRVQDSSLKITFNETQRKPYQYLQHVLLKEGAKEDALFVGEMGRARDFYDKVASEGDQGDCLNTPQALLDFAKSQKVAVLFLSTLKVVNTLCGWFISSDGSIEKFSAPLTEWEKILIELCVTMHQLQGRYKIEFRGIEDQEDDEEDAIIEQALKKVNDINGGLKEEILDTGEASNFQPTCQPQTCATTNQISTRKGGSYSPDQTESTSGLIPELLDGSKSEHELPSESEQGNQPHEHSAAANSVDMESLSTSLDKPSIAKETKPDSTKSLTPHLPDDHGLSSESVEDTQHHKHSEAEKSLSTLINKLSELVVKPIESHLEKLIPVEESTDKPQLLIIPQGMTFDIPYAALHLNGKPLCSQVTPLEAFSFHSFSHSIQQHEKSKEERDILQDALVVGNPTNDLPGAEAEAIQIADVLGVRPLIGESATRDEVLSRLPHQRIIHFACHGQYNGSSLQMAPVGKSSTSSRKRETFLTIKDIERLKIRADMVVLSACHTARGEINSEGVLGLARAFLMAGAKSVVTALWAIPDKATEHFMEQFYSNLSDGQPVADALRTTMCQMQDINEFKNVVNWGSFKAFGANQRVL